MITSVKKQIGPSLMEKELGRLESSHGSMEELEKIILQRPYMEPSRMDDLVVWNFLASQMGYYVETVTFHTTDIHRFLTPSRMDIIESVERLSPSSIKDLSTLLKRDYKNVYDDVDILSRTGIMDMLSDGKNRRPVSLVERIEAIPEVETVTFDGDPCWTQQSGEMGCPPSIDRLNNDANSGPLPLPQTSPVQQGDNTLVDGDVQE